MLTHTDVLDKFDKFLRSTGKQPSTVECYCSDVKTFIRFIEDSGGDIIDVEPNRLTEFQEHYIDSERGNHNSARRAVIGVRQFYRFLCANESINSSPFDATAVPKRLDELPKTILLDKVSEVIESTMEIEIPNFIEARQQAIVALLGIEALKTNELIDLNWDDWLHQQSSATVLVSKGRRRTIEISASTNKALLKLKSLTPSNSSSQPIITTFKISDSKSLPKRISRHGLKFVLYEIGNKFNVKHLNSELLRHVAIDKMILNDFTPERIMSHLGLRQLGNIERHFKKLTSLQT
jgi:integrase/recombinase XerD